MKDFLSLKSRIPEIPLQNKGLIFTQSFQSLWVIRIHLRGPIILVSSSMLLLLDPTRAALHNSQFDAISVVMTHSYPIKRTCYGYSQLRAFINGLYSTSFHTLIID